MSGAVDVASAAGPGIGAGLGAWGGLRFLRWAIEFASKRFDVRSSRIDQRERALEQRFNDRLRHVEDELDKYRRATMLLVNRMARRTPQDPVLVQVAEILGTGDGNISGPLTEAPDDDPELSSLIRRAKRTGE